MGQRGNRCGMRRHDVEWFEYQSAAAVPDHLRSRRQLERGGLRVARGQGSRAGLRRQRKRRDGSVIEEVLLLYDMRECE
jgi:hypothetical protein